MDQAALVDEEEIQMTDPVLKIPAPMLEVAEKLYHAMGLHNFDYTLEDFQIACFLEGMLTKWENLLMVADEKDELQKIIDEVSASHGMSVILVFLDEVAKKIEVDK